MLPAKLKNMNLFNQFESYLGMVAEVTMPKISHAMEDWRGAGMVGPIKMDMGLEALEAEWTVGGIVAQIIRQMGTSDHDGVLLRFRGAYQADDASRVMAVEAVMRGRHQELDMGSAKPGEDTEHKVKTVLSYYKLIVDGETVFEVDMLSGLYIAGGVDRTAQIRNAIS